MDFPFLLFKKKLVLKQAWPTYLFKMYYDFALSTSRRGTIWSKVSCLRKKHHSRDQVWNH